MPMKIESQALFVNSKIEGIFDSCEKDGSCWTSKLKEFFAQEIPNIIEQLPWLNQTPLHHLQSKQVVRFRGMIQDMLDPEFYLDTYAVKKADGKVIKKPGRYLDVVSCLPGEEILFDSKYSDTKDRTRYMCISIPGENQWVKEAYSSQSPKLQPSSSWSAKEDSKKRGVSDESENEVMESTNMDVKSGVETKSPGNEKRFKEKESSHNGKSQDVSDTKMSKFPFHDSEGVACMLKIYDELDFCLNDVIEAVGILSLDPSLSSINEVQDTGYDSELQDATLPPSLSPRLHILTIKKKLHCNPLLPSLVEKETFPSCSSNIRELFGSVLDVAFLGDGIAAEYFICHLISSVYLRQDILPLGKFSINLSGITPELQEKNYPAFLFEFLQKLTTHSYFFQMTLDNMNKIDFIPKKDYQGNCLKSGLLQLPANLHLVVDETKLTAGQLDTKGIRNITALGTLINWQKVDYDFQFHSIEQHTNVPVLILSEGKAMIACDTHIKLEPKHTDVSLAFDQVNSLLTPRVLEQLRTHMTLARLTPYTLSEDMQKMVQNDFVSSRRHEDGMSADDLRELLVLAKLLAQSCGKLELTQDIWKSAKMLEVERKGRLRNNSSNTL